jgi:hypothetical protein
MKKRKKKSSSLLSDRHIHLVVRLNQDTFGLPYIKAIVRDDAHEVSSSAYFMESDGPGEAFREAVGAAVTRLWMGDGDPEEEHGRIVVEEGATDAPRGTN